MASGGNGKTKAFQVERSEARLPMQVGLRISGNAGTPGMETTFTENVSSRGARVRSVRRWQRNENLWVMSLRGDFRSRARVAYCQSHPGNGYDIGLEFLELEGQWVLAQGTHR